MIEPGDRCQVFEIRPDGTKTRCCAVASWRATNIPDLWVCSRHKRRIPGETSRVSNYERQLAWKKSVRNRRRRYAC